MHNFYQYHEKALLEIAGIKFTQREMDVISCIIRGRGSKKIGDLLNITPKTAEAHVRNIMMKVDCNSRERIIDFVEGSRELQLVNRHYSGLLKNWLFLKQLADISKNSFKASVILAYDRNNAQHKAFFTELETSFKSAGIVCSTLPLSELHRLSKGNSKALIVFPYSPNILEDVPPSAHGILIEDHENEPESIPWYDFRNEDIAYNSFYSLLKVLIPSLDVTQYVKALDVKEGALNTELSKVICDKPLDPQGNVFVTFISRKVRNISLTAAVFIVFLSAITVTGLSISFGDQFKPVRAEMAIPQHEYLLERQDLIKSMSAKLKKDKSNIKILALVGIGGSGKSTLARQFARTDRADVVWEIEAQSSSSIYNSFESFAYALAQTREEQQELEVIEELRVSSGRDKKLLRFVKQQLKKHDGWLLIYVVEWDRVNTLAFRRTL